jgi:hypothetical protein
MDSTQASNLRLRHTCPEIIEEMVVAKSFNDVKSDSRWSECRIKPECLLLKFGMRMIGKGGNVLMFINAAYIDKFYPSTSMDLKTVNRIFVSFCYIPSFIYRNPGILYVALTHPGYMPHVICLRKSMR